MRRLQLAGYALISAVFIALGGQLIAMLNWDGIFLTRYFFIGDLGVRECGNITSDINPRYLCSPGYPYFVLGWVAAGGLLILAGALILSANSLAAAAHGINTTGHVAQRYVQTEKKTIMWARVFGIFIAFSLGLAGIAALFVGTVSVDFSQLGHDIALSSYAFCLWAGIIFSVLGTWILATRGWRWRISPQLSGCGVAILVFSAVGLFFYLRGGYHAPFGLYQRMWVDSLHLWLLMLGANFIKNPIVAEKKRAEKLLARNRRQAEKDAAVKAVGE